MASVKDTSPKISNSACMFSITRLLQHFNDANVKKFRQLLIKELGYDNEAQLLCKILLIISRSMTNETLQVLKNATMTLAEQQPSKDDKTVSVCTQMKQKYKDRLSNLNSDIIDYFGTFLSKKQSIEIGYLNKQLYIETQKQSYLLKRLNDPPLVLNSNQCEKFFDKQTNQFPYSLPTHLHLSICNIEQQQQLQHSQWYTKNAFSVLNNFQCDSYVNECLAAIPIKQFFCQNRNRNLQHFTQQARSSQIKKFEISATVWNKEAITTFCNNFTQYFILDCKNNVNNVRNIEQLTVENTDTTIHDMSELLLTLGQISNKIKMISCQLHVDTINELQAIFHTNLKAFEYDVYSIVEIDNNSSNNNNNDNEIKHNYNISDFDVTDLQISIIVQRAKRYAHKKRSLFRSITKQLRMQGKVQCLKIHLLGRKECRIHLRPIFFDVFNIENAIDMVMDHGNVVPTNIGNAHNGINTVMNETIMIIIHDDENLYTFAEILDLFNNNRLKILDSTINNVQKITFEFCLKEIYHTSIKPGDWNRPIWRQESDSEYPVDSNTIEYTNCELEEMELGVLYQNIIKWLQSIQNKYGSDKLKQAIYLHMFFNKI